MGQILLVRHGQASFGASDYDALSPLGFEQARLLGVALDQRSLDVGAVVRGSMRRHRETAETCAAAAGWSGEMQVDEGWDEFDFLSVLAANPMPAPADAGDKAAFQVWFEAATADWTGGADLGYPETFVAFAERVGAAMTRAAERSGTTVVVTSGGPLAWVAASALAADDPDISVGLWPRLNRVAVNTGLTRLIAGSRGINLVTYNDHAHLDGVPGALSYR